MLRKRRLPCNADPSVAGGTRPFANTYDCMADIFQSQGRLEETLKYSGKALVISELLGKLYEFTLILTEWLGYLSLRTGVMHRHRSTGEKALAIQCDILGARRAAMACVIRLY